MLRGKNTQSSIKSLFITTLVASILLIALVVGYLSLRQASFTNIQPYHIEVMLDAQSAEYMVVDYDYGYGFNAGHQQILKLTPNQSQTINFTVSAWKRLKSLRISSDQSMTLNSLMISKNGIGYQAQKSVITVSAELPLELKHITHKLLGMSD